MTFTDARRFPTIDYIGRTVGVYDGYEFEPDFDDTDCDCCFIVEDHATITAATLREFVREYGDICGVPVESQNDFLSFCHVSTGDVDVKEQQLFLLEDLQNRISFMIDDINEGYDLFDTDIDVLLDSAIELGSLI